MPLLRLLSRLARSAPAPGRHDPDLRRPAPDGDARTDADALLALVARGDRDAFAALYDRFADRVFGLAYTVVRDTTDAEEVTLAAFTELWRSAPRFDPEGGEVAAWLLSLAHRHAVARVRAQRTSVDGGQRAGTGEQTAVGGPVTVTGIGVGAAPDRDRLPGDEHGELTGPQRRTLELAYYGASAYGEIAVVLDTSPGTVASHLRDGLIHLREGAR